jgi:hypothetical protein
MRKRPVEIIHRPNELPKKAGKLPVDAERLEKARATVAALAQDYRARLAEDARLLNEAWNADGGRKARLDRVYRLAHDIKGQGTTFGYPLATAVAAALCEILASEAVAHPKAGAVVEAHITALLAIATEPIEGAGGAAGAALLDGLKQTREKLGLDA